MDIEKRMKSVWEGGMIYKEACTFVEEDGNVCAPLLYLPVKGSLIVQSYDEKQQWEEGIDFYVEDQKIWLTKNSRIPYAHWEDFILPDKDSATKELAQFDHDLGFGPVATKDGHYITLKAIDHPEYITKWTVSVTYETKEKGMDVRQHSVMDHFPKLKEQWMQKKDCHIVLYGDSISHGCDCSGLYDLAPNQPVWIELVRQALEQKYQNNVTVDNISMPSADSVWAKEHCAERMKAEWKADLVILGYGMNDRCSGKEYKERTIALIKEVRKCYPDVPILLIATTLPNVLVPTPPICFYAKQEEFPVVLYELEQEGIAVADVQKIQTEVMKQKRFIDLTGNFLNHPNDYLARIQAQTIFAALNR